MGDVIALEGVLLKKPLEITVEGLVEGAASDPGDEADVSATSPSWLVAKDLALEEVFLKGPSVSIVDGLTEGTVSIPSADVVGA